MVIDDFTGGNVKSPVSIFSEVEKVWRNKYFQFGIDVCRILLVIIAILTLITLVRNIEEVKILNNNACKLCEQKTGATCMLTIGNMGTNRIVNYNLPEINLSNI